MNNFIGGWKPPETPEEKEKREAKEEKEKELQNRKDEALSLKQHTRTMDNLYIKEFEELEKEVVKLRTIDERISFWLDEQKKYLIKTKQNFWVQYIEPNETPIFITLVLNEIESLEKQKMNSTIIEKPLKSQLEWDNKTNLAQLVEALFLSKAIKKNGKEIQQNELIEVFSNLFNCDLKTFNTLLSQGIKNKTKPLFTDTLSQLIKTYAEDKDKLKRTKVE